jgi:hypothetical protein
MAKYHIGKDGVQRICNAKNKPCPYGATSEHYESLEKATEVADKLNEILSKPDSYGMAKVGGTQVVDKNTEVAVLRLANAKQTINKLKALREQAKQNMIKTMEKKGINNIYNSDVDIKKVDAYSRKDYDTDRIKQLPDYEENYTKPSIVKEHAAIKTLELDNKTTPTLQHGKDNKFGIRKQANGEYALTKQGTEYVERLRKFDEKMKELEATEKRLRETLQGRMKEANISSIKVGKVGLEYNPETTKKILDRNKLSEAQKEEFAKETKVGPSLRLKFSKTA